jgi:NADH-quinone oxidoreductase subunit H
MFRRRTIITVGGILLALAALVFIGSAIIALLPNPESIGAWAASANDPARIIQCSDNATCNVAHPIVFGLFLVFLILTGFAYTTLLERKLLAWLQQRTGPNRAGPGGFLQPVADGIKLIFKEDIIPDEANKAVYYMAPLLKAIPVLIVVAVIPLGPDFLLPWFDGNWYVVPLGLSDVNVGILWILGITSLATYGIVLAGWSSNNKYAMLGGLRASAQMISYELSLGLTLAVPVIIAGSMSVGEIIDMQKNVWDWFVFQNPLAAGIMIIALFAEVSRAPFDLSEAEQELTAGYMTEYSGMKFALFMMAEYIGMITVSLIAVALFFGGYHLFPVDNVPILGPLFFIGKVVIFLSVFIWVRGTLPRIRYDRLMAFGWKALLPLSLVSVAWTAIAVVLREASSGAYIVASVLFFLVVVVGGFYFLSNDESADAHEDEYDMSTDPLITGERTGAGWIALNLLGGLIAIPFAIVNGLASMFENIGEAGDPTDESAIVPTDSSQGGD